MNSENNGRPFDSIPFPQDITEEQAEPMRAWLKSTGQLDAYLKELGEAHDRIKADLDNIKARELDMRKAFVIMAFDPGKTSGTERVEVAGTEYKAVKKENISFTDLDELDTALDEIEALGEVQKHIANEIVKWSADLSLTAYKKAKETNPEVVAIIDRVIVKKAGAPTLEKVAPKKK
jgi:hypothetical protein